jgi:hypothetical protein
VPDESESEEPNIIRLPPQPSGPGSRATVFVPKIAPQYDNMVERSQRADTDPREWRMTMDRAGIWVSLSWISAARNQQQPREGAKEGE